MATLFTETVSAEPVIGLQAEIALTNDFDTGSGSVTTGSSGADGTAFDAVTTNLATFSYDNNPQLNGKSGAIDLPGTQSGGYGYAAWDDRGQSQWYGRMYAYFHAAIPGALYLASWYDSGSQFGVRFGINSSGQLQIVQAQTQASGGFVANGSVFDLDSYIGEWLRFEWYFKQSTNSSTSDGQIIVRVYDDTDTLIETLSDTSIITKNAAQTPETLRLGITAGVGATGAISVNIDEIGLSSLDWVGAATISVAAAGDGTVEETGDLTSTGIKVGLSSPALAEVGEIIGVGSLSDTKAYTFNGGSHGANVATSDTGSGTQLTDVVKSSGAGLTYTTTEQVTGVGANVVCPVNTQSYCGWDLIAGLSQIFLRFYVKIGATLPDVFIRLAGVYDTSGNRLFSVGMTRGGASNGGALQIHDGSAWLDTGAEPLPVGQWARVEVKAVIGVSGSVEARIYAADPQAAVGAYDESIAASGNTYRAGATEARFGVVSTLGNTASANFFIDEIAVRQDDWIGPVQLLKTGRVEEVGELICTGVVADPGASNDFPPEAQAKTFVPMWNALPSTIPASLNTESHVKQLCKSAATPDGWYDRLRYLGETYFPWDDSAGGGGGGTTPDPQAERIRGIWILHDTDNQSSGVGGFNNAGQLASQSAFNSAWNSIFGLPAQRIIDKLYDAGLSQAQVQERFAGFSLRYAWRFCDWDLIENGLGSNNWTGTSPLDWLLSRIAAWNASPYRGITARAAIRFKAGGGCPHDVVGDGSNSAPFTLVAGLTRAQCCIDRGSANTYYAPRPWLNEGSGTPRWYTEYEQRWRDYVDCLIRWAGSATRANASVEVPLVHLSWYGMDWAEIYYAGPGAGDTPAVTSMGTISPYTTPNTFVESHRRLMRLAAGVAVGSTPGCTKLPSVSLEAPMSGRGTITGSNASTAIMDLLCAEAQTLFPPNAGDPNQPNSLWIIQANGWGGYGSQTSPYEDGGTSGYQYAGEWGVGLGDNSEVYKDRCFQNFTLMVGLQSIGNTSAGSLDAATRWPRMINSAINPGSPDTTNPATYVEIYDAEINLSNFYNGDQSGEAGYHFAQEIDRWTPFVPDLPTGDLSFGELIRQHVDPNYPIGGYQNSSYTSQVYPAATVAPATNYYEAQLEEMAMDAANKRLVQVWWPACHDSAGWTASSPGDRPGARLTSAILARTSGYIENITLDSVPVGTINYGRPSSQPTYWPWGPSTGLCAGDSNTQDYSTDTANVVAWLMIPSVSGSFTTADGEICRIISIVSSDEATTVLRVERGWWGTTAAARAAGTPVFQPCYIGGQEYNGHPGYGVAGAPLRYAGRIDDSAWHSYKADRYRDIYDAVGGPTLPTMMHQDIGSPYNYNQCDYYGALSGYSPNSPDAFNFVTGQPVTASQYADWQLAKVQGLKAAFSALGYSPALWEGNNITPTTSTQYTDNLAFLSDPDCWDEMTAEFWQRYALSQDDDFEYQIRQLIDARVVSGHAPVNVWWKPHDSSEFSSMAHYRRWCYGVFLLIVDPSSSQLRFGGNDHVTPYPTSSPSPLLDEPLEMFRVDLGSPTNTPGSWTELTSGTYVLAGSAANSLFRRNFANGVVYVNRSGSVQQVTPGGNWWVVSEVGIAPAPTTIDIPDNDILILARGASASGSGYESEADGLFSSGFKLSFGDGTNGSTGELLSTGYKSEGKSGSGGLPEGGEALATGGPLRTGTAVLGEPGETSGTGGSKRSSSGTVDEPGELLGIGAVVLGKVGIGLGAEPGEILSTGLKIGLGSGAVPEIGELACSGQKAAQGAGVVTEAGAIHGSGAVGAGGGTPDDIAVTFYMKLRGSLRLR